jgi:hypothetical protein
MPKGLWSPMWLVDTSSSLGCNFCIESPFGALSTSSERSIQELDIIFDLLSIFIYMLGTTAPKKHYLGPQNGPRRLGPEKL